MTQQQSNLDHDLVFGRWGSPGVDGYLLLDPGAASTSISLTVAEKELGLKPTSTGRFQCRLRTSMQVRLPGGMVVS